MLPLTWRSWRCCCCCVEGKAKEFRKGALKAQHTNTLCNNHSISTVVPDQQRRRRESGKLTAPRPHISRLHRSLSRCLPVWPGYTSNRYTGSGGEQTFTDRPIALPRRPSRREAAATLHPRSISSTQPRVPDTTQRSTTSFAAGQNNPKWEPGQLEADLPYTAPRRQAALQVLVARYWYILWSVLVFVCG